MKHEILDDDLFRDISSKLSQGEELVWSGSPKKYFSLSIVELFLRDTYVSALSVSQIVTLVYSAVKIKTLLNGALEIKSILWLVLFWIIVLIPEVYKNHRKNRTRYALTNQRVIIETWSLLKPIVYEVPLGMIKDVRFESYKNGYGMIYLMPDRLISIKTRDFFAGRKRHYPTLELIEDCERVTKLIQQQINLSNK
ncbi:MAG: hypothetical protein R3A50_13715 [Saprospiraceae bacterium]|nr:hypothetical protein [Saprospiraceae bacterium]MCB9342975.1 hypothetical protein [Lewinellaceae bacterium]